MRADHFDTVAVHAGEERISGSLTTPVFHSSTYEFDNATDYHDIRYLRLSNSPTHAALHAKLAALEGGEAALTSASGMASISAALFSVLGTGDHILIQDGVYGGTQGLLEAELARCGITFDVFDPFDDARWTNLLSVSTRAIYCEAISNPTLSVPELAKVVAFAQEHGLVSIIDNTFASPVNLRAARFGFDITLHSATKYLNGHSDIVAGVCVGSWERIESIRRVANHLGSVLDPNACFLLQRGLKTLGLRVHRQNSNALELARWLAARPEVVRVAYPGLDGDPQNERALRFLTGFGGMLAFDLGSLEAARRFVESVRLAVNAPSLGGVETLVTIPALTSHAAVPLMVRERQGIGPGLVRVSVGIEGVDDLRDDFATALST